MGKETTDQVTNVDKDRAEKGLAEYINGLKVGEIGLIALNDHLQKDYLQEECVNSLIDRVSGQGSSQDRLARLQHERAIVNQRISDRMVSQEGYGVAYTVAHNKLNNLRLTLRGKAISTARVLINNKFGFDPLLS